VVVRGRVQAVGFRAGTESRARALGLAGWVRNAADGSVEAEVEGPRDRVEALLDWFRHGPRGALVADVAIEWREPLGEHGFVIR
jgi:acylphosphatase